jgi:hypothetical protein
MRQTASGVHVDDITHAGWGREVKKEVKRNGEKAKRGKNEERLKSRNY